jgi:hypothetical protein
MKLILSFKAETMDIYIYKTRWKETNKMFTTDNSIGLQSQRMRKEITNITVCVYGVCVYSEAAKWITKS